MSPAKINIPRTKANISLIRKETIMKKGKQ